MSLHLFIFLKIILKICCRFLCRRLVHLSLELFLADVNYIISKISCLFLVCRNAIDFFLHFINFVNTLLQAGVADVGRNSCKTQPTSTTYQLGAPTVAFVRKSIAVQSRIPSLRLHKPVNIFYHLNNFLSVQHRTVQY